MNLIEKFPDKELYLRIKTILLLRTVFLTGFVISVYFFHQHFPYRTPVVPLSLTLALAYLFCIVYAVLLKIKINLFLVSFLQVAGDLLVTAGILFSTGGIESPFSVLYSLVVVATSVMLPRAATYLVASLAGISYGLLLDLEYYDVIQPIYLFAKSPVSNEGGYVFYIIFLNIVSYYAVAFLSSLLSHRLNLIKEQLLLTSSNLEKLQAFHKDVVQNMENGLLTADLNGRIISMNPAAGRILNQPENEALGKACFEILPIPTLQKFFLKHGAHLPTDYIEETLTRNDGSQIHLGVKMSRLTSRPGLHADAETQGYIVVFEDVTLVKEMKDKMTQAEQLAVVGRFSAGLAHEIRNPLASISGSIQVLKKDLNLEEPNRTLMDIVLKETQRLNRIVSDFLHFANPRKDRPILVDMAELVREVVSLLKNSSEYQSSLDVQFQPDGGEYSIHTDEQQIKQLVWNLCLNAMQAMDFSGSLKIDLHAAENFQHGAFKTSRPGLLLTVEDSGCGISPASLKTIFDPFFTTKENGVGLGLARVKQIVEHNEGCIKIDSEVDKGTRFTIYFPRHREEPELEQEALAAGEDRGII